MRGQTNACLDVDYKRVTAPTLPKVLPVNYISASKRNLARYYTQYIKIGGVVRHARNLLRVQ